MANLQKYSKKQIAEAIKYWESELEQLQDDTAKDVNEAEEEEEEEEEEEGNSDDAALKEKKAPDAKPIGKFNVMKRIVRLHNTAVKKAKAEVVKQLNKTNAIKDEDAVIIENSLIDDDEHTFDYKPGATMQVTMKVLFDKAHVKGFRKLMAVLLKEEDEEKLKTISEGFFGTLGSAIKAAGKEAGEKASASIKTANEELAKTIGVAGLKTYIKSLCGEKMSEKVKTPVPGVEEEDGAARFVYKTAVTLV